MAMIHKKKPRIFLGLSEISGFYQGLELGFKKLNIDVTRIDLGNHPYQYSQKKNILWVTLFHKAISQLPKCHNFLQRGFWKCISITCKILLFINALFRHDIFIFSYGTSFFRLKDLAILKWFGKKIIFQFHGSDSRPPYIDGTLIHNLNPQMLANMTASKKSQIKKINYYADAIIDTPTMGLFHEKPFINWLHVGLTVSITTPPTRSKVKGNNNVIKILHAPSNPQAKGTKLIEETIASMIEQGYKIELMKVHNQPHQKVKEALADCDFVIDQLFADYPMPGFATESAWFAKPTIICGYATNLWAELLPSEYMPPTYYCHPNQLEEAVKKFCDNESMRNEVGQKAFKFVSTKWAPVEVAKRYLRIIENDIPQDWLCFPEQMSYVHGCCIEENILQSFLKTFISDYGKSVLKLEDKPKLESLFLAFASNTSSAFYDNPKGIL